MPTRGGASGQVFLSITPLDPDQAFDPAGHANLADFDIDHPALVLLTGAHAAVAALGALRWARREGRPAHVAVAGLEVLASCLGETLHPVLCPLHDGAAPPRASRLTVLPCADGYVAVAAPTSEHRRLLAGLTGIAEVADADTELGAAVGAWVAVRSRDEVFHEAQLWQLPVVPVLSPAEVLADEQCIARGVWSATPPRQNEATLRDARRTPGSAPRPEARSPFRVRASDPAMVCSSRPDHGKVAASRLPARGGRRPGPGLADLVQAADDPPPSAARMAAPRSTRPGDSSGPARPPLDGIRVLDLGMVWAGPYCGRLLAALGASVVKIEGPRHPDGTRRAGAGGCAGVFADLNHGKASLALDLATAAGRAAFLLLAERADILVENFSPRVMPNLGLGPSALAKANPRLASLALPAFGSTGPWASYVAYGSGLELATGLAVGCSDDLPRPAPVPYLDYLAGAYGAAAVLAALLARDAHGAGCHIEIAQREIACQVLAASLEPGRQDVDRTVGARSGSAFPSLRGGKYPLAPSSARATVPPPPDLPRQGGEGEDRPPQGSEGGCAHLPREAERLVDAAPTSELSPRRAELLPSCSTFAPHPAAGSRRAYGDLDAAALVTDPRLRASGLFATPADAEASCTHFARPPWRIAELEPPAGAPAPALGADSRAVLRDAGLTDA